MPRETQKHNDTLDAWGYMVASGHFEIQHLLMQKIWRQRDGTETPVKEMESTHIHNIISMLKSNKLRRLIKGEDNAKADHWANAWITVFEKEIERRNQELIKAVSAKSISDIFPSMKRGQDRNGKD